MNIRMKQQKVPNRLISLKVLEFGHAQRVWNLVRSSKFPLMTSNFTQNLLLHWPYLVDLPDDETGLRHSVTRFSRRPSIYYMNFGGA